MFLKIGENANGKFHKSCCFNTKNSANDADADAVVFIQGGPGASGVQNIGSGFITRYDKK